MHDRICDRGHLFGWSHFAPIGSQNVESKRAEAKWKDHPLEKKFGCATEFHGLFYAALILSYAGRRKTENLHEGDPQAVVGEIDSGGKGGVDFGMMIVMAQVRKVGRLRPDFLSDLNCLLEVKVVRVRFVPDGI